MGGPGPEPLCQDRAPRCPVQPMSALQPSYGLLPVLVGLALLAFLLASGVGWKTGGRQGQGHLGLGAGKKDPAGARTQRRGRPGREGCRRCEIQLNPCLQAREARLQSARGGGGDFGTPESVPPAPKYQAVTSGGPPAWRWRHEGPGITGSALGFQVAWNHLERTLARWVPGTAPSPRGPAPLS